MYNGIGLTTARGSGTSGYVQKNLSHVKPYAQQTQRDSFLKELQALKDNVLAPPKKANKEILLHQQKRDIQLQLVKMRDKLEQEGKSQEEIDERVRKAEKILNEKLASGELELQSTMDYHKKAQEKEKEYERVRQAFAMPEDYKPGSAFDFETQEKKRLEQLFEKEKKKYEQKKAEKKAQKELLAEEERILAIEGENSETLAKLRAKNNKEVVPEGRKTNAELRQERESRQKRSPVRHDRRNRRSRSPRRHDRNNRRDREDRNRGHEKDRERPRRRSGSRDKRRKERSESRSRSRSREKEESKRKVKRESKEKEKEKEKKKSSSSERSKKSNKSEEKETTRRKRHDSSSSSRSRSRSASSSSSGSASSGSRSD